MANSTAGATRFVTTTNPVSHPALLHICETQIFKPPECEENAICLLAKRYVLQEIKF